MVTKDYIAIHTICSIGKAPYIIDLIGGTWSLLKVFYIKPQINRGLEMFPFLFPTTVKYTLYKKSLKQ